MPIETVLPHGVMEGKGSYNTHAKRLAGGAKLAAPFLEKAVQKLALHPEDRPLIVADYGSSQGKNSLIPMQIALRNLQPRVRPNRPILVFHVDQPSNDFNSFFQVLSSDPDRYARDEPNVFSCAIGRSFYEQVLPSESVHLGWSSFAAVWLRRIPCLIPGHFFPFFSTGEGRAAFERQAAEDWQAFLSVRACEMRPGARLIIVLPGLPEDGSRGFARLLDQANAVLIEMVDEGAITTEERSRMALASYPRRKDELLAPFTKKGCFEGLVLEDCDISTLPDAAWLDYLRDGNEQAMATKQTMFFRVVFMPSLASALTRVQEGDAEAQRRFCDRMQDGLTRRLASHPAASDTLVQTLVLSKSA